MNRMEEVAKMFGLELGEQFNVGINRFSTDAPYAFTREGIADKHGYLVAVLLEAMIRGEVPVQKLPSKPKKNDAYWTYNSCGTAKHYWDGDLVDLLHYKAGMVFKTERQAKENLAKYKQELEEYYNNN